MSPEEKALIAVEAVERYLDNTGIDVEHLGTSGSDLFLRIAQVYATLAVAKQLSYIDSNRMPRY